jgi:hypothetical protein
MNGNLKYYAGIALMGAVLTTGAVAFCDSVADHTSQLTVVDHFLGTKHLMNGIEKEGYYVYEKVGLNDDKVYRARILSKKESLDGWKKLGLYQPKKSDKIFLFLTSISADGVYSNIDFVDFETRVKFYETKNSYDDKNLGHVNADYFGILDDNIYNTFNVMIDFSSSYSDLDFEPIIDNPLTKK